MKRILAVKISLLCWPLKSSASETNFQEKPELVRHINFISFIKLLVTISALLLLSGCAADTVSFQEAENMLSVGFWQGFWHGFILLPAWIGSLFSDNIAIYAIYNNGGWYDFGYILGVGGIGLGVGIFK